MKIATHRWCCYADSFDHRIRIVAGSEAEAREVAAKHGSTHEGTVVR